MGIATAAKQILFDDQEIVVGGGVESVSLVQNDKMNTFRAKDPWLEEHVPVSTIRCWHCRGRCRALWHQP